MQSDDKSPDLVLRPAVPAEYPRLLDIQCRAYRAKEVPLYGENLPPLAETPESLEREAAEGKNILVGEIDGTIVASLRTRLLDDGAVYWCRLSVDPDLQGRGIGQRMGAAVEEFYPDAKSFVLDCGEKSVENFHIYSKLGYRETGESHQVPNGPRVLVMRKER